MNSLSAIVLFPLAAAVCSVPFLFCAYIIIGFVDQKLPDFDTMKTYWQWSIWLGGVAGIVAAANDYISACNAVAHYEAGWREWRANQEQLRQERERADTAEAERMRRARMEQDRERQLARTQREREQAEDERRQRIYQLETYVLRAQAQHRVDVDFFGTSDPIALLTAFRQQLGQLTLSDLGLLRESRLPQVCEIVGDGCFLPPTPPLRLPPASPF